VSKRNLITAIHTYRHVLCLTSSSSLFLFLFQDHRPLNRPVIGETLSSLVWTDKQHIHAYVCVRPGFMIILLFLFVIEEEEAKKTREL
jgi:hypothetical protein